MSSKTTRWILQMVDRVSGPSKKVQKQVKTTDKLFSGLQRTAKNVFAIIGISILSFTTLMAGAVSSTALFNNEFLELKQLNLSKPQSEIDGLRKNILRTAFDAGLSAKDTSKAYFDMQSATGLYGAEVDKTVAKVGKFGIAVKANNDALINATAKSMGIWKFGSDQVDNYLASMAKTVQVGVTTFDQLAQVQVDYAGAGAAANQSFDQANKLFAVFTKSSKSVAEAATSTKTAFMGLTDPRVQKGLKKYGINLFDIKGELLGVDEITKQLVDTVGEMNGKEFSKFMGSVGGPEGFKILLQQAKANGEGLLNTFKEFDNTKFDIGQAIKNANGDVVILAGMFKNRLNTAITTLGQRALPTAIIALQSMNDFLGRIFNWFDENGQLAIDIVMSIASTAKIATIAFGAWFLATNALTIAFGIMSAIMAINPVTAIVVGIMLLITLVNLAWKRSEKFRGVIMGIVEAFKSFGRVIKDHVVGAIGNILKGLGGLGKALSHLVKGQFGQARTAAKQAAGSLFNGIGGLTPHGMVKASAKAGLEAGNAYTNGYAKGFQEVARRKGRAKIKSAGSSPESQFNISSVTDDDTTNTAASVSPVSNANGLSGAGSSSGKSITVNQTFNTYLTATIDGIDGLIEDAADKLISLQTNALTDVLIQNG